MMESAVVYPLTFFIILSIIIGAMGIFRYQEMAALAREAARYGSTHGAQYRKDAGLVVGTGGEKESGTNTPLNTGASPYNVSPWNTMLWFQTHPTATASSTETRWADIVYDNTIRNELIMLDPGTIKAWVGWPPVQNQPTLPDNFPGSRIVVAVQYPLFPESFIWWNPDLTRVTVSTSAMPITN